MSQFAGVVIALLVSFSPAAVQAESGDHEAVDKFFDGKDPFVQQTVLPNIEKHRKSDITLRFVDPKELKKRYPGISYLALHAHRPRRLWASPQDMYREFDKYLGSGIKLHLTEFGIDYGAIEGDYRRGEWTEGNKAEYFVQVWAVAFSHPAVEAFNTRRR